ncbi:hypothetical protein OPV22_009223 [Ensete ventricosum]|uniref:Uncharacterized protein n=1 Tax=Ensete ventricosum TaxID=4639 RepID=A0AAV8RHZ6_ENSVE|nr:hypothetical protein OPV22_009223 [Ensete ventricosum]
MQSAAAEGRAALARSIPMPARVGRPRRSSPTMGNVNEGKGLFAPAPAPHSQVIAEFSKTKVGSDWPRTTVKSLGFWHESKEATPCCGRRHV